MHFLASLDLQSPFFWGILVAWIASVVVHEFCHGLVAYLGGDYTIRERGGLSLNPLRYVDPMMSLVLPAVFLALGGIPLPGGATYIRVDLLRSRLWRSLVSAAGPASNLLLSVILIALLNPRFHWYDPSADPTTAQLFVGAMAFLQFFAACLNLLPVPPLDGFGIIEPFLPPDMRMVMDNPNVRWVAYIGIFVLLWFGFLTQPIINAFSALLHAMGNSGLIFQQGWDYLWTGHL